MRKALVIGVNYYEHFECLHGCVNDAHQVRSVLERHENTDKDINFEIDLNVGENVKSPISKNSLKDKVEELFLSPRAVSLFYFSGHGHIESSGGYLITSECKRGDDGLSMYELLKMVNESPASSRVVILDCCHSGNFGTPDTESSLATVKEGVTILAASAANQYSFETKGSGVFTGLLIDAMKGGAANVLGEITPGSLYAHIDKSLGELGQRPIFKTNVRRFTVLRRVFSQLKKSDLLRITEFFRHEDDEHTLDPSYEPESNNPVKEKTRKFAILQKYNRVNLLIPVGAPHMYFAAMESKSCVLTALGKHYWRLVKNKRL